MDLDKVNAAVDARLAEVNADSEAARLMRTWWQQASRQERADVGLPGSDLGEDVDPVQFLRVARQKFGHA